MNSILSSPSNASHLTAEHIAIGLLQSITSHTPVPVDQMKWLVSEEDVPQKVAAVATAAVVTIAAAAAAAA